MMILTTMHQKVVVVCRVKNQKKYIKEPVPSHQIQPEKVLYFLKIRRLNI